MREIMTAPAAIIRNVETRGLIPLLGIIPVVTVEIRLQPAIFHRTIATTGLIRFVAI
jgi:hypothetical protein